jgi:predicted RNA-binding protein with PIN domain
MSGSLSRITLVAQASTRIDCQDNTAVASGMPTHLIIDGYNLLGGSGIRSGHSESAREMLLHELTAYRHRKHHSITVVFDGWQQGRSTEQREHRAGVQVIFSKRGERADQVIQRLAREYGTDCAVVSSDHEIINAARAHGAFVMGALEFAEKLRGSSSSDGALPYKELDPGDDVRSGRGPQKKGNPRKLPKSQRQRNRQFKRF